MWKKVEWDFTVVEIPPVQEAPNVSCVDLESRDG